MPEQNQSLSQGTPPGTVLQKWYTRPSTLAALAIGGSILVSKKTRKPALIGGGALMLMSGLKDTSGPGGAIAIAGGLILFLGLRSK